MRNLSYNAIKLGDEIPSLTKGPITRTVLGLFAGASGDHNPIHIDIDFARAAGMPDVFAHGMLSMAYLGQVLTNWVPQSQIRSYGVRFSAITHLQDSILCSAKVVEKFEVDGEKRVRLEMNARNQNGNIKLIGEAIIVVE